MKPLETNYFKEVSKFQYLSKDKINTLWKKAKKGDKKAKEILIENNLRIVLPIAKKYQRPTIDLMDLIEEGNIGLLQAIKKYNPRKKVSFSTYAKYWIEQYIRRAVELHSKTIRIPPHIWGNLRKWIKTWEQLHSKLGRYPTIGEMAKKMQMSMRQVKNIVDTIELSQGMGSLETPIDEDEELFVKDVITDKESKTPESLIATLRLHDELEQALSKLNKREREILEMRYGLQDKNRHTLEEIGKKLKLSRERVRQLEKRALFQLKWIAHKMKLI
ncbi:MAG: RNA polymerase sigma factor RpoD/SigA [Endomicrobiia bacterium]